MRGLAPPLDLLSPTLAILDHRLAKTSTTPIALGLSGGGDSVALALMVAVWARAQGRALHLLTVDHQLNPASVKWNQACASFALRLGAIHQVLSWTGSKPATGLPAAARLARHRLLADQAREIGARVILLGHTADDRAEGQSMRQAGSTTPDPREWSPSPVWPEGRGVFILRPMLDLRRGDLREWLTARAETWIEDPANQNPKFARARARAMIDPLASVEPQFPDDEVLVALAAQASFTPILALSRDLLRKVNPQAARAFVGIASLCVSGGTRPPRTDKLSHLVAQLVSHGDIVATLAGARIEASQSQVRWLRNPGELIRHKVAPLELQPNVPAVWDGRYEITSTRPSKVVALQGHMAGLSANARQQLRAIPAAARGGLPLVQGETSLCPLLENDTNLRVTDLTRQRFYAATGLVISEPT